MNTTDTCGACHFRRGGECFRYPAQVVVLRDDPFASAARPRVADATPACGEFRQRSFKGDEG